MGIEFLKKVFKDHSTKLFFKYYSFYQYYIKVKKNYTNNKVIKNKTII